ncbi:MULTISPECIES: isochorismatase family cysteine hydrolase [unclassified Bradyrhizobium]|uniref:cysteine hydrolase family protein n=1 Tax=unclassified Bradyrhizobium TaxID=2631580 RepID=UPI003398D7A7
MPGCRNDGDPHPPCHAPRRVEPRHDGRTDRAGQAGYINEGTETAKLHPGVDVGKNDIMLYKPRYRSFTGTDLDQLLRGNGIDSIIVTGICTNICCETTAREAGMKDYHVFFPSDGTETFPAGGLSVEEIKKATLTTLGIAFAKILTVDETIDLIKRGMGGSGLRAAS